MTSEGHVVIEEEEYLDITELKRVKELAKSVC